MLSGRNGFMVAIATVLACGALTSCAQDPPRAGLEWRSCPERPEFDCATVTVPIDWSAPDATIDIAVVRDRADDPNHRVGTLISLPGGPGTSGVDQILRGTALSPRLRAAFDIVSIDPRGVGRSHPVRCDEGLATRRPQLAPDAGASLVEVHSYARDLEASCREHTGPLLDHVDAVSVARDVEALRVALGEERVTLYSRSYGTMPAQAYAELFPRRVRASVLDSVDDHSRTGDEFLADEARAGQDAFDGFTEWCATHPDCVLHGRDVAALYANLRATATEGRLRAPGRPDAVWGPVDLASAVIQYLYAPTWPDLARTLFDLAEQAPAAAEAVPSPRRGGVVTDYPGVIVCADWRFDIPDQARWLELWERQRVEAPVLGTHFAWAAAAFCSGMSTPVANPQHVASTVDTPPVLVLNARHDPATPHGWASGVASRIPGARLVTWDGRGHGGYDRTECTRTAVDDFLLDPTTSTVASCPAR
ncbi:alpha/beta hydrolase [Nocardia bovistercoris]|uniref:Alpha/beta fold hydrolase n=1 Tax=Nocardia bovistercoris TaxID=2785916 RepID=A0A931ICN9_9NOCA|nr:alpha/beta hydrolase [Nocardia bovistercoris]MBH0779217.1 alpha/beta fold hydrolase [Nocardia bovistercoris]